MSSVMSMPREEYIEQEYFFRVYRERLQDNVPSQEILKTVHEEILSTTQLPMAIDFMRAEILHAGCISTAMQKLPHYFTPFQTFVIAKSEEEVSRFEQVTALEILEREAKYRATDATMAGVFVYQFECLARNRLGYGEGLQAIAGDSCFSDEWKAWIQSVRSEIGAYELSELVYRVSEYFYTRRRNLNHELADSESDSRTILFGEQEGRIAKANMGRDPLYFFAALQRQLNYPEVPMSKHIFDESLPAFLEERLNKIEQRLKLIEMENKGGIDLTKYYKQGDGETPRFSDDPSFP